MYSKKPLLMALLAAGILAYPAVKKDAGGKGPVRTEKNLPAWGLSTEGSGIFRDGISTNEGGSLVLDKRTRVYNYMWLPDLSNGVVSKFDVNTGEELARYHSVSPVFCKAGQTPEQKNCVQHSHVNVKLNYRPNRTAVDLDGNVWVANDGYGAGGRLSSVTKIAAELKDCVDRNGNGRIDTSHLGAGGHIVMVEQDECVLLTTPVCGGSLGANALAISKGKEGSAGDVWVGCYDEQAVYQLDSRNGQIKRGPIALGMSPSGAIVDGKQTLWLTNIGADVNLQGIDTRTGETLNKDAGGQPLPLRPDIQGCGAGFGLSVDSQNRVWVASSAQNQGVACFYNHYAPQAAGKWRQCQLNAGGARNSLGIAVDADDNVYMPTSGQLLRFRWNEEAKAGERAGKCEFHPLRGKEEAVDLQIGPSTGVGFDKEGNPWSIGFHQAARVNLKTGKNDYTKHAAGSSKPAASGASTVFHAFSDFTGYQLKNFTAPRGVYKRTIQGCERYSSPKSVSWQATAPKDAKLQVYLKVANTENEWSSAHRYGPFETSPVDLSKIGAPQGSLMQLEFVLLPAEDKKSAPVVHGYEMKWACERPSGASVT